ncbi:MAG: TrkA family potassium uptake protein [Thermoanaerobaculales bacterium]|jgi:trk system potassium uptake protein TrkA|nr:TrkA family potassium uptake protein [Thermoanaerobaculales bacterium]
MADFCVIGLGMFGRAVALSLTAEGQAVLGVDSDQDEVDRLASELETVVCADATDEQALRELRIERVGCSVVAIGAESMEASILTTTLLRQLGAPQIVARALGPLHARVLRAVGAHRVVSPEWEMGESLARQLAQPSVLERFDLGDEVEVAELEVPRGFVGRTLVELDVRRRFGVSVAAIRRGDRVLATLDGSERIQAGDVLVVIGRDDGIAGLAALA